MQTRENERREFLRRLRREPLFLCRHAGALSAAVYRKVVNRIRRALAGVHRGRKTWPEWLTQRALPQGGGATRGGAWPQWPQPAPPPPCAQPGSGVGEAPVGRDPQDPEDHLADNRWGFLLEALLAGVADREAGIERCRAWIAAHTDRTNPAWEAYSSCERVANLLVFLAAMPPAHGGAAAPADLAAFVEQSLKWVYRHLEYYGPAETNNHILNNARALAMGGAATANRAAVDAAVTILRQCLPEMVAGGGFLRERSSHYQLVVLNWLLDSWAFIAAYRGADDLDARFLRGYAERMVAAAALLCDGNGRLIALVGDVSPDATPAQSLARLRLLYPELWPPAERVRAEGWCWVTSRSGAIRADSRPTVIATRPALSGSMTARRFLSIPAATGTQPMRFRSSSRVPPRTTCRWSMALHQSARVSSAAVTGARFLTREHTLSLPLATTASCSSTTALPAVRR
jgi:hypothetical protein